jgi:hypothetical protein
MLWKRLRMAIAVSVSDLPAALSVLRKAISASTALSVMAAAVLPVDRSVVSVLANAAHHLLR